LYTHFIGVYQYNEIINEKGVFKMEGVIMIGVFGMSLVGIGIAENAGFAINEGILNITMTVIKFSGLIYVIKLASSLFL